MSNGKLIEMLNNNQLVAMYEPAPDGKMAKTFQCSLIWNGSQPTRSFIKFFKSEDTLGLINEITGYVLAKHSDLPVPQRAGLIKVDLKNYDFLDGYYDVGFVMTAAQGTTPASYFSESSMQHCKMLMDLVANWPKISETLAFDDWVANEDRNLGNLLVTNNGEVTLIDHSNLPITLNWAANQLNPNLTAKNKLLLALGYFKSTPFPVKAKISQSAKMHDTHLQNAKDELYYWWGVFLEKDPGRLDALKKFIDIRAKNSHSRISAQFGMLVI